MAEHISAAGLKIKALEAAPSTATIPWMGNRGMELGTALSSRLLGFAVLFLCPSDIICLSHVADIDSLPFPPAMSNSLGWDSQQAGRLLPASRNLGGWTDRPLLVTLSSSRTCWQQLISLLLLEQVSAGQNNSVMVAGWAGAKFPGLRVPEPAGLGVLHRHELLCPLPGITGRKSPLLDKFASESVHLLHSHLSGG